MNAALKKLTYLKLLTIPKDSPFWVQSPNFHERLVYSYLAYCDRIAKTASKRCISRETGLTERSVAKSLANLAGRVINQNGKWSPVSGKEDWLPQLRDPDGDHWSDKAQYVKLLLPQKGESIHYEHTTKRFGILHAATYSQIVSLARRGDSAITSETGLSTLLSGVNRKTIGSLLNDLDRIGLISRERTGSRMKLTLLPVEERHLKLFRPKPKVKKLEVKEPKPPKPRSGDVNSYQLKGDKFDKWRELCRGLMPQSYAEAAIKMSFELLETLEEFQSNLNEAHRLHEDNLLKGKVAKGHFGKYFVNRYAPRYEEFKRRQSLEEENQKRLNYWNSDEYRAKEEAKCKAAAADPLHKHHTFGTDSMTSRVQLRGREAMALLEQIERHVANKMVNKFDPLEWRSKSHALARNCIRRALSKLNHHFEIEEKATVERFIELVNQELENEHVASFSIPDIPSAKS